jgi:NTP pyrophosphatase (non-canonical NTP hydrolase)
MEKLILDWAKEKGILDSGTPNGQLSKLQEEFFELSDAILEKNVDEIIDGIGDMTVVLIILADMFGLSHTECLAYAYNQIKDRKGKMENGTFVKDA